MNSEERKAAKKAAEKAMRKAAWYRAAGYLSSDEEQSAYALRKGKSIFRKLTGR